MKSLHRFAVAAPFALYSTMSFSDILTIDLAKQSPGSAVTLPAGAFPEVSIRVINRAPKLAYSTSVEDSIIPILELTAPTIRGLADAPDTCDVLLKKAKELSIAIDEETVGKGVQEIQNDIDKCKVDASLLEIRGYVARTTLDVPGVYRVQPGHQLTITVSRDAADKKTTLTWVTIVKGEDRGLWLTTYGAVVTQNEDARFFTSAAADDKFTILPETASTGAKVIPSVFFTWLPRARQSQNWSFGPTAGFGVKEDKPALYLGASLTYNWNLGVVVGVSVIKESRLNGKYTPKQLISENLSDDQLHIQSVQPRLFVGVTFRFGSNPFEYKAASEAAPAEKKKDEKKDDGK